jgi:hypothetical protein
MPVGDVRDVSRGVVTPVRAQKLATTARASDLPLGVRLRRAAMADLRQLDGRPIPPETERLSGPGSAGGSSSADRRGHDEGDSDSSRRGFRGGRGVGAAPEARARGEGGGGARRRMEGRSGGWNGGIQRRTREKAGGIGAEAGGREGAWPGGHVRDAGRAPDEQGDRLGQILADKDDGHSDESAWDGVRTASSEAGDVARQNRAGRGPGTGRSPRAESGGRGQVGGGSAEGSKLAAATATERRPHVVEHTLAARDMGGEEWEGDRGETWEEGEEELQEEEAAAEEEEMGLLEAVRAGRLDLVSAPNHRFLTPPLPSVPLPAPQLVPPRT